MAIATFRFRPVIARRLPDPNFKKSQNAQRYVFVVPVKSVPEGLPLDPNARRPNTNKRVYQAVEQSLLNQLGEPGTFHLKNKGITIIAREVQQVGDAWDVKCASGHGIVDGGHTYKLIVDNLTNEDLPEDQFVTIEVRTGIPDDWIPEIAGGLNTSVQVQDMSLDNLKQLFSWIVDELRSEKYFPQIAWSENDPGEYDARDIIGLLMMFNAQQFPNAKDDHPVAAYEKKSAALKLFEEKGESFKQMRGILKDILRLHDIVSSEARDLWNKSTAGKAGHLSFMEGRKRGLFHFHFIGKKGEYRLMGGALYPILGAFRWYVDQDERTFQMHWRGGFNTIINAWRRDGPDLLKATKQMSDELGRNPNAIGKSRPHWANLHTIIAKKDLMSRAA
jgi:hypothetical protein